MKIHVKSETEIKNLLSLGGLFYTQDTYWLLLKDDCATNLVKDYVIDFSPKLLVEFKMTN